MALLKSVRCPDPCRGVLMEIGPAFRGTVRVKCPRCRHRLTVLGDEAREIWIGIVDVPPARIRESA